MTYIIVEPCVGLKDSACVDVCPVTAIFAEDAVPADMTKYIAINYDYFKDVDPSEMKRK